MTEPKVEPAVDPSEDTRFISRKFILTVAVLMMVGALPIVYKILGVSETVTMTVLILCASVGAAYGFMNVKDAKVEAEKTLGRIFKSRTVVKSEEEKIV